MDLSSLTDEFLSFLEFKKKASPHTLKDYRYYLSKFNEFHKQKKLTEINDLLIDEYKKFLNNQTDDRGQKFKLSTKNYFLIALRSFFNFLEQEKGQFIFDSKKIRLYVFKRSNPQALENENLFKLFQSVNLDTKDGLRDRLAMEILNLTGLKVSEVSLLNRDHIDLTASRLMFIDKNGYKRSFSIPSQTLEVLKRYLILRQDDFKPLFIRFKGNIEPENEGEKMRISSRSIERLVEKYVKKSGLSVKITPLKMRHNFAFKELEIGKDLESLRLSLGHLSKNSAKIYSQAKKSAIQNSEEL